MKTILCFGDSNTWGYRPDGAGRFEWKVRWPGILQRELSGAARVIEEGLNARTTVFDDPVEGVSISRNGSRHLPILLETHRPIDLVIIFLGVVEDRVTGPLILFGDSEKMTRAAENLIQDATLRTTIGRAA